MNKQEFLERLRASLNGLPSDDIEGRIAFYNEMLDDKIEEGMSEQEAVKSVGSIDEIVTCIVDDIPLTKLAKERIKPKKRLSAWEITLIVLGFPIWFSLLAALFAVVISLYAVLWCVIICLWAVFVSFIAAALGGIFAGVIFAAEGNLPTGAAMLGASLVCIGLSVFMFFGAKAATKGILILTKRLALKLKACFIKKGEA